MGIKGIYGEIGPGERIAFSKLAVDKLSKTGQPFRVAIDVSIWQFQTQAGQGGSNPAIRTFYYRLLRLLSLSVQPLFIFDGPHKPPFKRNKKSGRHGVSVPDMLTKQMLKLFGFPFYQAPGEAEAECALLQREGMVDAVLSEDVDTLMFGCGQTLRNWSSEGSRGNKAPTHVSVYDAKATKEGPSGLDREGMVLIALMSGGDYITEGIPGCGIKVACQAARAGYGKSLCQLSRTDVSGLEEWRNNLNHEMQTNESKYFKTRHKTLQIPDSFPDKEVLGYYTHPVVSSATKLQKLRTEIIWGGDVDVPGLRLFVAEAFEWTNKAGAVKFIRGLAPALLVHKLISRRNRRDSGYNDLILTAMNEMELVRSIAGTRNHFSTDGIGELRLVYQPLDIVALDLDTEYDDSNDYGRDGLAPVGDNDQIEGYVTDTVGSPTKRGPSHYDPNQLDKVWVSAVIARMGIPLKVEDYEEYLRDPKKTSKEKAAAKRAAAKTPVAGKGPMDLFIRTTKPVKGVSKPSSFQMTENSDELPPVYLVPVPGTQPSIPAVTSKAPTRSTRSSAITATALGPSKPRTRGAKAVKPSTSMNPWSLASSIQVSPPVMRISKNIAPAKPKQSTKNIEVFSLLSSSPMAPSPLFQPSQQLPSLPRPEMSPPNEKRTSTSTSTTRRRSHSNSNCSSPVSSLPASPSPLPQHKQHAEPARESLESLEAHIELDLPSTVTISRHRSGRGRRAKSIIQTPSKGVLLPSDNQQEREELVTCLMVGNRGETVHDDDELILQNTARKLDFTGTNTQLASRPAATDVLNTSSSSLTSLCSHNIPDPFASYSDDGEELAVTQYNNGNTSVNTLPLNTHTTVPKSPTATQQKQIQTQTQVIELSSSPIALEFKQGHQNQHQCASQNADESRSIPLQSRNQNIKSRGKYIALRKSLAGAWKEVDGDEDDLVDYSKDINERNGKGTKKGRGNEKGKMRREGMWRVSQVEVLDLSHEL